MTRGEPILRRDVALQIAVSATGASRTELENALDDPETSSTISASSAEFNAFAVTQRPAFVIRSEIEDTAIFSGIYRAEPILAAIDAMIADENAYAQFAATHPPIPKYLLLAEGLRVAAPEKAEQLPDPHTDHCPRTTPTSQRRQS